MDHEDNMTYAELVKSIEDILPGATFGEDNDGQLIIYTNKSEIGYDAELIEMEEPIDGSAIGPGGIEGDA